MSSVEQKIREVMDELQAQVIDGYAGPVNGWSTLKDEATQALLQIIESEREYAEEGWGWVDEFCKLSGCKDVFELRNKLERNELT